MGYRVILIIALLLMPCAAWGDTHAAASAAYDDVNTAIGLSETGDTVTVPAGDAEWTAANKVTADKAITLKGAGIGSTNITLSGAGALTVTAGASVTGFTFLLPDTYGQYASFSGAGFRFTGNLWTASGEQHKGQLYVNQVYGLIDNNTFEKGASTNEMIFVRGPQDSWTTDDSIGTANNVFIENNTFSGSGYPSFNSNARVVFRYNTITGNIKVDAHGKCTNSPNRGVRHYEIYNNLWTYVTQNQRMMEIRGGTGRIFNNQADVEQYLLLRDYASIYTIDLCFGYKSTDYPPDGACGCPSLVPLDDMIGVGKDPKSRGSEPLYLWNNTNFTLNLNANAPNEGCRTYCNETYGDAVDFVMSDIIVENTDYFNSETKPEAMSGYTPYQCPHPSTGLSGTCSPSIAGRAGYNLSSGVTGIGSGGTASMGAGGTLTLTSP